MLSIVESGSFYTQVVAGTDSSATCANIRFKLAIEVCRLNGNGLNYAACGTVAQWLEQGT